LESTQLIRGFHEKAVQVLLVFVHLMDSSVESLPVGRSGRGSPDQFHTLGEFIESRGLAACTVFESDIDRTGFMLAVDTETGGEGAYLAFQVSQRRSIDSMLHFSRIHQRACETVLGQSRGGEFNGADLHCFDFLLVCFGNCNLSGGLIDCNSYFGMFR
jgi:hypothetical protein